MNFKYHSICVKLLQEVSSFYRKCKACPPIAQRLRSLKLLSGCWFVVTGWRARSPAISAWGPESPLSEKEVCLFGVSHHRILSDSEIKSWQSYASRKRTGKGCCQWDSLNLHSPTRYDPFNVFRKSENYIPEGAKVADFNNIEVVVLNTFIYNPLSLKCLVQWRLMSAASERQKITWVREKHK